MNKMKLFLYTVFIVFLLCLVFVIFPFLCNQMMNISSFLGYVSDETKGAWIGYIGAAMGGVITLIGVILTWRYNEKVRIKTYEDNLKLTNEQLRLEKLPYLTFEIVQKENFNDLDLDSWNVINIGNKCTRDIYIFISIGNRGINLAKNVKVQIIVDDIHDHGQLELCQGIIQVNETKYKGVEFQCDKNYVLSNLNKNVSVKLIFFYEDILGNNYEHEYDGTINFVWEDNKRSDVLCINFNAKEPKLTKISYYYVTEGDILRKEKEKEAIKKTNDILNKRNSFSRRAEFDLILRQFNDQFYNNKMNKLINYIIDDKRDQGGGGEGQEVFEVLSDKNVLVKNHGGFSFGEKELSYSYILKVDLDDKIVSLTSFKIVNQKNISLPKLIKIKLLFIPKKIKC